MNIEKGKRVNHLIDQSKSLIAHFVFSLCIACTIPLASAEADHDEPAADADNNSIWRFLDRQYLLDNGYELPGRFGIAPFILASQSELEVDGLKFSFSEDDPLSSNPIVTMDDLESDIINSGVLLDYWLLPFLSIYGTVGYLDGEMDTAVNVPGSSQPIPIDFTGTSYGLGANIVIPYKQAFLLLDYNYMKMDTSAYEKKIPMETMTARLGWKFSGRWLPEMAWASYIDTTFKGTFDLLQQVGKDVDPGSVPPGTESVYLQFQVAPYHTYALGGQWKINDSFHVVAELGVGTVESLLVALNYRWD
ncbi:MAG: hypothetical protein ABJL54_02290 [Halioglobus sp.]